MFKTILAATDGSEAADKAMAVAGALAKSFDSRLVVMHVVPYGAVPEKLRRLFTVETLAAPGARPPTREAEAQTQDAGEKDEPEPLAIGRQIVAHAEQTARDAGVEDLEAVLERGDPARRIVARAKAENADLIVVGSRGLSDLEGLLLGSVSHKVAHLAECTCATVR